MTKVIDLNGFWKIEDNPITKEGVFPYLGEQISPDLEPKKIYMVYRPASELTNPETIESFNGVPFIDEHEMVGDGFTKYDQRPAGGVLFNPKADNGILVGDFKIFSETMKDEISNGKKELSLGYLCDYELKKGVWNGQYYDAVQKNIRGNHVALVDRGRMGSDVRVYDKAITMDRLPVELRKDITKMSQDKDEIEWITVNGAHIPIKKGQSKGEAVREFLKDKSSEEKKEKQSSSSENKAGSKKSLIGQSVWFRGKDKKQYKASVIREDGARVYLQDKDGNRFWRQNHEVEPIEEKQSSSSENKGKKLKINGEWKEYKSPKEELVEYAEKNGDPEYIKHVKGLKNEKTINERLQWHRQNSGEDKEIPAGVGSPKESGENGSSTKIGVNNMAQKETMDADKREAIREVMAIANKPESDFEGGEEEKIETIAKILEKSEYSKSESGTANDEDPEAEKDKKGEDKCGKDEDDYNDEKGEDEDAEEKKAAEDEMPRKFLKMIAHRNEIVRAVEPHIGSFACDEMTAQDAAVYACKKLGLQANAKEAELVLRGYLAASKSKFKRYGLDSAVNYDAGVDKATVKYLKGE